MSDKAIEILANKLGVATDQLIQVFINQATLVPWIYGVQIGVCILVLCTLGKVHMWLTESDRYYGADAFTFTGMVIVSILTLVVVVFGIHDILTSIYNPQAWAIKEILGSIK
ncbi:hypothetical protein [Sporomusa termitida]|uniref:Uncharacterized protein n=1 Tax=Sporomusa termitida TaxID=2377 RepID=A0A517DSC4_9FIRM|nr:hypothetical protein [Sporomusa termitida]QDR80217.1 hypothetical protein SPTER_15360 [Sporomusa termitida]